jgi:hypothetical protein
MLTPEQQTFMDEFDCAWTLLLELVNTRDRALWAISTLSQESLPVLTAAAGRLAELQELLDAQRSVFADMSERFRDVFAQQSSCNKPPKF